MDDLAAYLRALGCSDIALVEGRNIFDHLFQHRTVGEVADYFGIRSTNYRIVDTEEDQVQHQYSRGIAQYTIAKAWRDADFRISFPKLRSHPIEMALLLIRPEGFLLKTTRRAVRWLLDLSVPDQ